MASLVSIPPYRWKRERNIIFYRIYKLFIYFSILISLVFNSALADEKIDKQVKDHEERIESLEDFLLDIDERVGSRSIIKAFDGLRVDIGGFIHTAFTHVEGEDGSVNGFNRQNFELLIGADLDENWSAFFAGGFLRESDDPFTVGDRRNPDFNHVAKNPQIIAWVNYRNSDSFNVRIGRMITPHDSINIEHFPATLLDPEQPQMLRPFGGNTIFPNFSTGIQLHGKEFFASSNSFHWAAYATRHPANPNEEIFGGRLEIGFQNDTINVGLNGASGERPGSLSPYQLFGLDLRVDKGNWLVKSAYFATSEDTGGDRIGAYFQPAYRLTADWIVFYRFDILDSGDASGESTENVLGVNFTPTNNVRLRAIYTSKTMDAGDGSNPAAVDADADIIQFSGTFSF